ncbi:VOC family protein [Amycolatopsis thermoflava]|uniref:Extradiol dioxygenase family protein n=1 Tax=Amycolatopsis thermoflava TaxID=84480 RepID=A0A3N2GYM3_9PSEU|nr:VOC family protein [Amycolatopsis thermoflava]ROS41713.1 extradiol dioxygenase family protein [Amycolatopsis thermoflava]
MLTKSTITHMLPAQDADRARHFYGDQLGLRQTDTGPDGTCYFEAGSGHVIGLRPLPDTKPSENTVLSFEVENISAEVHDLEERGVRFADYDSGDLRTEGHIATLGKEKAAWFADSEGNWLCLHEVVR